MAKKVTKKPQSSKPKATRSKPKNEVTIIVLTPKQKSAPKKAKAKSKPATPAKKGKTK